MKVRDGHATINGNKTEFECRSGCVEIIAEDERTLFSIMQMKDGEIMVIAGKQCKHRGKILNDQMVIRPIATNCIEIIRPEYK